MPHHQQEHMGQRVKRLRQAAGLRREELAWVSDMSYTSFVRFEQTGATRNVRGLLEVAKRLGVSMEYLISGEDQSGNGKPHKGNGRGPKVRGKLTQRGKGDTKGDKRTLSRSPLSFANLDLRVVG